ncbi:hypothetical protein AGMMS49545_15610 [Betaproteobacteria bacterium]|nr:hypothetical protein AGMMS49545_15610 [Betaproteobacteria bacterium]GHU41991.1 hypothetical protein AGMMS50289_06010 [Betaproteobacteria bacterium]
MDNTSKDHALDRLLDSLNRFNPQQDEQEGTPNPPPTIELERAAPPDKLPPDDVPFPPLYDDADNIPNSTDALVSRANALMSRQNADLVQTNTSGFAPTHASLSVEPPATQLPPDDFDDLPVLTDIVPVPPLKALEAPLDVSEAPFTLPAAFDDEALTLDMEHLREDILTLLRKRLDAEMPSLIEAALQSVLSDIVKEIRQGLEDNVHAALNDILKSR